ncbi:MAG: phosphoribosylformylglycinamidine synthase subunit PurQ [Gemmatimonadetes bacterium]|nr:MAG: phosphoribosylformylglycinamidine synthase subunit PurQ [Gemmatimonadota bacterium]
MKFGVVLFPASNCAEDAFYVLSSVLGQPTRYVWHKETHLNDLDAVVIPGGFSYGDYLRPGAIAHLSPAMQAIKEFAEQGKLVIGICNGFQILTESGLLPGALLRNKGLKFICQDQYLRVEHTNSPFTRNYTPQEVINCPIAHNEGNYYVDDDTLQEMIEYHQILFRYCSPEGSTNPAYNPNGAASNIAGVTNKRGNVLGMMPHPERTSDSVLGNTDGLRIFQSMLESIQ